MKERWGGLVRLALTRSLCSLIMALFAEVNSLKFHEYRTATAERAAQAEAVDKWGGMRRERLRVKQMPWTSTDVQEKILIDFSGMGGVSTCNKCIMRKKTKAATIKIKRCSQKLRSPWYPKW